MPSLRDAALGLFEILDRLAIPLTPLAIIAQVRLRTWLLVACTSAVALGADADPKFLAEIGHLQLDSNPQPIHLGSAVARAKKDREVIIEGENDQGVSWAIAPLVRSGIGFTTVWQSDFDRNGRQDLVFAALFPSNGPCINRLNLTFILFDTAGNPVTSRMQTEMPSAPDFPYSPGIFTDLNQNGHPEFVATECRPDPKAPGPEEWRIKGIYEAKDAHWQAVNPPDRKPYLNTVRTRHRLTAPDAALK